MAKIIICAVLLVLCFAMDYCLGLIRVKRVIGGQPENSTDYGYLAILVGKKGYSWDILNIWGEYKKIHCSGALIDEQWIITAAHCFTLFKDLDDESPYQNDDSKDNDDELVDGDKEDDLTDYETLQIQNKSPDKPKTVKEIIDFSIPDYWKVRLAVKTLEPTISERLANFWNAFTEKSIKRTYYGVSKIIRHPDYTPWNLENDVALVKLTEKLNITLVDSTRVLQLSQNSVEETYWPTTGQICKVIGWGCTEYEGPIMDKPYSVNLPVISPKICRRGYRADINLTESQEFCAGYFDKDIGICPGDSGGPLICEDNGRPILAGVVMATHKNNPSNYPGIFARVGFFRKWINHVINTE